MITKVMSVAELVEKFPNSLNFIKRIDEWQLDAVSGYGWSMFSCPACGYMKTAGEQPPRV